MGCRWVIWSRVYNVQKIDCKMCLDHIIIVGVLFRWDFSLWLGLVNKWLMYHSQPLLLTRVYTIHLINQSPKAPASLVLLKLVLHYHAVPRKACDNHHRQPPPGSKAILAWLGIAYTILSPLPYQTTGTQEAKTFLTLLLTHVSWRLCCFDSQRQAHTLTIQTYRHT